MKKYINPFKGIKRSPEYGYNGRFKNKLDFQEKLTLNI
jgi:hypothetical protein